MRFSTDVDLLKWEPMLFRELFLSSQTLAAGQDGAMNGTTLTSDSASFDEAGVAAGHVVYLSDSLSIDGCYEVVSVDSATQLTLSVVRMSADDPAVAPPNGSTISYRISTFDPQAEEAAYSLGQFFGIKPSENEEEESANILNSRALRQASVFAVLSAVFASSASGQKDATGFWEKSSRYQMQFQTARARARLEIDMNKDNQADQLLAGGSLRLRRS